MGFLAPWFLAGIVAVGLPLWLHLLRQYRSTPQPFSSLMFFEPGRRAPSITGDCATWCCSRCAWRC